MNNDVKTPVRIAEGLKIVSTGYGDNNDDISARPAPDGHYTQWIAAAYKYIEDYHPKRTPTPAQVRAAILVAAKKFKVKESTLMRVFGVDDIDKRQHTNNKN